MLVWFGLLVFFWGGHPCGYCPSSCSLIPLRQGCFRPACLVGFCAQGDWRAIIQLWACEDDPCRHSHIAELGASCVHCLYPFLSGSIPPLLQCLSPAPGLHPAASVSVPLSVVGPCPVDPTVGHLSHLLWGPSRKWFSSPNPRATAACLSVASTLGQMS